MTAPNPRPLVLGCLAALAGLSMTLGACKPHAAQEAAPAATQSAPAAAASYAQAHAGDYAVCR
jgi:hypothetical protein